MIRRIRRTKRNESRIKANRNPKSILETRKIIKRKKHLCEGISDKLWKEIATDNQGHWFWDGKKIHKDDFWDHAWEEFQYYCEENGLDADEEDFDAWAESEDLDGMLMDVFANGEDYEDAEQAEPDEIADELKYWMKDNIEREEFESFDDFKNRIDIDELKDIFDRAKKNAIHVRPRSVDEFLSEMRESIEEAGGISCYKVKVSDMAYSYTIYCDVDDLKDGTFGGDVGFEVSYHKA